MGHEANFFFLARTSTALISMRQTPSPIYEQSKNFTLCNRAYETYASSYTKPQSLYWRKQHAAGRFMWWAFYLLRASCGRRIVIAESTHFLYSKTLSSLFFTPDGADTSPASSRACTLISCSAWQLVAIFLQAHLLLMMSVIVADTAWWAFVCREGIM